MFIVFIGLVLKDYFSDKTDSVLVALDKKYSIDNRIKTNRIDRKLFYYWQNNFPKKKSYINGMYVYSNQDGIYIQPTIFRFWLKTFFIPWSDLKENGKIWRYCKNLDCYSIENIGVSVSFCNEHKLVNT